LKSLPSFPCSWEVHIITWMYEFINPMHSCGRSFSTSQPYLIKKILHIQARGYYVLVSPK
jgi:hypothetical protein